MGIVTIYRNVIKSEYDISQTQKSTQSTQGEKKVCFKETTTNKKSRVSPGSSPSVVTVITDIIMESMVIMGSMAHNLKAHAALGDMGAAHASAVLADSGVAHVLKAHAAPGVPASAVLVDGMVLASVAMADQNLRQSNRFCAAQPAK
jgi:hypothetical protein